MSLAPVLSESGGVGAPAETLFTMGKELKEFQLCDSRRPRKKPQDAQDDVTELFDLFDAHFWGWKGIKNLDSQRRSSPVQHVDICLLPFMLSWFLANFLKQLDAFRALCRNPKTGLPHALSKANSGSAWQSHFWQCGTLRPARKTKSSFHITQVNKSWFCLSSKLLTQLGRTTCWSPKSQCVYGPKMIAAVTFFVKNGAALTKSNTFASVTEWQDSGEHGLIEGL